jgi:hypothetical protein
MPGQNSKRDVRFEVFTAVTMKNGVFWDVMSCGSCKKFLTRAIRHNIPEDVILLRGMVKVSQPNFTNNFFLFSAVCGHVLS